MRRPIAARSSWVADGDPWGVAFCALLVLAAALHAAGPLWDSDLFWHLKLGQLTLRAGHLLAAEPLTYTIDPQGWIQHEWGGQILLALIERLGGFRALRAASALLMALFLAILAVAFHRATGRRIWIAAGLLALAWIGAEPNASLRPHLFGWILAAATFGLWWGAKLPSSTAREFVALTLVIALWANLHSSALLAPLAAAGACVEASIFGAGRHFRAWLARFAAVTLGTLLSPAGIRLYPYAWETQRINIASEEWQPLLTSSTWTFRADVVVLAALLLCTLLFAIGALWPRRHSLDPLFPGPLVGSGFLVLALQHRRMAESLFVPLLASVVALRQLGRLRPPDGQENRARLRPWLGQLLRLSLVTTIFAIAARQAVLAFEAPDLRNANYPLLASEFLAQTRPQGHVLNPPDWGGYLSWRLHPDLRTFADGRWLEVGAGTIDDGARMLLHRADASLLDAYAIAFMIQPTAQYFQSPPLDAHEWRLAWIDPAAIVLLRAGPELDGNGARICAFRAAHPEAAEHFEWPFRLSGDAARTRVPSVRCPAH